MKAHIAIHVALNGRETVLASGLDGDPVIRAYKECEEPGKVYLFSAGKPEKTKRYHPNGSDTLEAEPAKRRGRPPKLPIE